jgi:hypothetical protein
MKRRICSYDKTEVPADSYSLTVARYSNPGICSAGLFSGI